jgi:branched-chain amino acid:cation transporter, LIVCS family
MVIVNNIAKKTPWLQIIITGVVIFSVFFGAGNITFSLLVGRMSRGAYIFGFCGFFLTSVVLPLFAMLVMMHYKNHYKDFFYTLSGHLGVYVITLCFLIMGPLIGAPRMMSYVYECFLVDLTNTNFISQPVFSAILLTVLYLMVTAESPLTILLSVLSGLTLIAASISITSINIFSLPSFQATYLPPQQVFIDGVLQGCYTLDYVLGYFMLFIVTTLSKNRIEFMRMDTVEHRKHMLSAILIGLTLLTLVYFGIIRVAAAYSGYLQVAKTSQILPYLVHRIAVTSTSSAWIMGTTTFSLLFTALILLSFLTTMGSLTWLVTDQLYNSTFKREVPFKQCATMVVLFAFLSSWLDWEGILYIDSGFVHAVYLALFIYTCVCVIKDRVLNTSRKKARSS